MANTEEKVGKKTSPHLITLKNILIGVVTTVLATSALYLLGLQNNGKSESKKRKEATVKVWNEYLKTRKHTQEVMESMKKQSSEDIELIASNMSHEFDIINKNMEELGKTPDLDRNLEQILNIHITQNNDFKFAFNAYFNDLKNLAAQNPTNEEGMAFVQERAKRLRLESVNIQDRDTIRMNDYYSQLEKDYKLKLPEE